MTVRIAQFVHATNDVVDEAFLCEFPEIEAVKADSLETLADALLGAEIFHSLQFRLHARVRETGTSLSQDVTRALQLTLWSGKLVNLSIEKLAGEFGRGLASLEDFFFGLILEFCVLVQGKTIFSRKDANLF